MPAARADWADVMDRLIEGDRLALVEVSQLVASFLWRWNAYDFQDEWDDLIQEVVVAAASALADGRIRDRAAVAGYLKSTARFKLADRLRLHLRCHEDEHLPWDDVMEGAADIETSEPGDAHAHPELRHALERLDPAKRAAVVAVYAEGMSYEEASKATGLPLGTLKRNLRDGLGSLRRTLRPRVAGRR